MQHIDPTQPAYLSADELISLGRDLILTGEYDLAVTALQISLEPVCKIRKQEN